MSIYSSDYKPLPTDWRPPAWFPPYKSLKPVDADTTENIKKIAKERIDNPINDRIAVKLSAKDSFDAGAFAKKVDVTAMGVGAVSAVFFAFFYGAPKLLETIISNPIIGWTSYLASSLGVFGVTAGSVWLLGRRFLQQKMEIETRNQKELKDLKQQKKKYTPSDIAIMLNEARKNPLFEQVFASVAAKAPLNITAVSENPYQASHAACCPHYFKNRLALHEIKIADNAKFKKAFSGLLFEFVNVYQMEQFIAISDAAEQGKLSKEEFAMALEYVESNTCSLVQDILAYGVENLNWHPAVNMFRWHYEYGVKATQEGVHPFTLDWKNSNEILDGFEKAHADSYREHWERNYRQAYEKAII